MNTSHSSAKPSKSATPVPSKAPLVPAANVKREKAKLREGREELEEENRSADTFVRTSVIGDRLNTP
ncbi:MAG: hypothetical protein ABI273_17630 [Lacunisphaera sp.]